MCECFNNVVADYQVTDLIENIDMARILRENQKAGCQYVAIITEQDFAVFFTKKLAKRIDALDIGSMHDVADDGEYGFSRVELDENGVSGSATSYPGNVIRSTGYVRYITGVVCSFEIFKNVIDNLDMIEAYVAMDEAEKRAKMNTVKVVAG